LDSARVQLQPHFDGITFEQFLIRDFSHGTCGRLKKGGNRFQVAIACLEGRGNMQEGLTVSSTRTTKKINAKSGSREQA
jgi:hypothetical protein